MTNFTQQDETSALAQLALRCLDLTELGEHCTATDVAVLCRKAQGFVQAQDTQARLPPVAAVCVWPKFVAQARLALPASIRVAAVVNFPSGQEAPQQVLDTIAQIRADGGDEVDCVWPYTAWLQGQHAAALSLVRAVRAATQGMTLKIIFETGVFADVTNGSAALREACAAALDAGVDFLKTSTGKTAQGATLAAAQILLAAIAAKPHPTAGFKPSGGLRSLADVQPYVVAVRQQLGDEALKPERFRIGASSLYQDIARILAPTQAGLETGTRGAGDY